jgi:ankyrin repeat protein
MSKSPSELIHRYLMGIASQDEVLELETLLSADDRLLEEFLFQAELDAHLRQETQCVTITSAKNDAPSKQASSALWKWISGASTLATTILIGIILFNMPPQRVVLAYPSLGELTIEIPGSEQNLWTAVARGDLEAIRLELNSSVSADAKAGCGLTPLHIATLANQPAAVELLLANGADVSVVDREGNTALHMASFLGRTNIVVALLRGGANPDQRNHLGFSSFDNVAITWSAGLEDYYRHIETVLNTRLDLERIRAERPRILRLLVSEVPIPSGVAPPVSLWRAAMTGNTAAVQQHLRAGTDINAKEDFGGSTPLILAAIFGQAEIVKILIDAGAELDLRNSSGGTALHQACFFGRPEIVELILNSGADPHLVNSWDFTPLDLVTIEFDDRLEETYRHVYESLGLEFDAKFVSESRLQIAGILRELQSDNVGMDHQ